MEQSLTPIKDVLMQSGMKIGDIYAVELIGGATRVLKLHAIIALIHSTSWIPADRQSAGRLDRVPACS